MDAKYRNFSLFYDPIWSCLLLYVTPRIIVRLTTGETLTDRLRPELQ